MEKTEKTDSNGVVELKPIEKPVHALVSPSGMWAVKLCPYAAKMVYGWEREESEAAKRGTLLHEAVYNDDVFNTLNEEEKKTITDIREMFVNPFKAEEGAEIKYETRLELKDENGNVLTWGIADFIVIKGDVAQLIDWKFGFIPVDKFWWNPQLKCYTAMIYQNFPQVNKVYAMIAQPAVGLSFDTMAETTREEHYERLLKEASDIVGLGTNATENDCTPSPDVCKYCRKDMCKAYQTMMMSACSAYNLTIVNNEELAELPPGDLVNFCDERLTRLEVAKQIIKEQEAILKPLIVNNGGSNNYRVVKPYMRKTTDWKTIAEKLGATEEMIDEHTTFSSSGEPYLRRKTK